MSPIELNEVMTAFERVYRYMRLDREKCAPVGGFWYQSGETNDAFRAFLEGYALGKAMWREANNENHENEGKSEKL